MDAESMIRVFAEPMRYRIWCCLLERKHCVRSLSKKLGISESAVSQHMKVMRNAGLVYGEQYGYHTHYLPKQEAIDFLCDIFLQMKEKSQRVDRDMIVCQCEYQEAERQ